MQPCAVRRDSVIELCGDAAVWRWLDARKPEIFECFSAGAQACCAQRQRREHGHNADIHATDCAVRLWARSWRLNAHFSAVSRSPYPLGGFASSWHRISVPYRTLETFPTPLSSTNSLSNTNGPTRMHQRLVGPLTLKSNLFNGVGRLRAYMSATPNADVSALGSGGEAQC